MGQAKMRGNLTQRLQEAVAKREAERQRELEIKRMAQEYEDALSVPFEEGETYQYRVSGGRMIHFERSVVKVIPPKNLPYNDQLRAMRCAARRLGLSVTENGYMHGSWKGSGD